MIDNMGCRRGCEAFAGSKHCLKDMNFLLHNCPLAKEFITQKKGHSLGIADAKGMPFGG